MRIKVRIFTYWCRWERIAHLQYKPPGHNEYNTKYVNVQTYSLFKGSIYIAIIMQASVTYHFTHSVCIDQDLASIYEKCHQGVNNLHKKFQFPNQLWAIQVRFYKPNKTLRMNEVKANYTQKTQSILDHSASSNNSIGINTSHPQSNILFVSTK